VDVDGQSMPVLNPVDNLLYTSMHLMLHIIAGNARLIHLHDIHCLCPRLDANQWDQAWERARQASLHVYLAAALSLARSILGTQLAETVVQDIGKAIAGTGVARWLRSDAAEDTLMQDWTAEHSSRLRLARLSALFARSALEKPRAFAQPLIRTALPSAQFLRRKYGLQEDQAVVAYYIPHVLQGISGYARHAIARLRANR
jgi:hypothetical protein